MVENKGESGKPLLFTDDVVVKGASEWQLQTKYLEWKAKLEKGGITMIKKNHGIVVAYSREGGLGGMKFT